MKTINSLFIVLFVLMAALLFSRPADAVKTIGTDELRPGMKGYGLTVFSGTGPVRFEVEVISVVPNFLLRQDVILIRCDHSVTDHAGVIGGMSGSPIFFDGRLAGALAYGWRFGKDPIAGVTAIEDMLAVSRRPQRDLPSGSAKLTARRAAGIWDSPQKRLSRNEERDPFFSLLKPNAHQELIPAQTPLTLGGFGQAARDLLASALSAFGMDPVAGGGTGSSIDGSDKFVDGGAIGVQLIRGDMSATGIGTVTLVDDKNVLAFGHPMFNMGEGFLPVTTAYIHTVIASLSRSNKLGSPLKEAGSLIQDRNAAIMARTDKRAFMIPMTVTISDDRSRRRDQYNVEIASHRLLTPRFAQAALVNIINHAASDLADVTVEMTATMKVSQRPAITFHDSGASRTGLASLTKYFRPVSLIAQVLGNPFEEATVESLDFTIRLHYGLQVATIVGAYLTSEQPAPGDNVNVHVRLQRYDNSETIMTTALRIPESTAGQKIQIEIAGGDFITPVMPVPQSLDDILENVGRFYPPKSLVLGINVPGEGISIRGDFIEQLPQSAMIALQPNAGFDQTSKHKTALRKVLPTKILVEGKHTIRLTVADRRNR